MEKIVVNISGQWELEISPKVASKNIKVIQEIKKHQCVVPVEVKDPGSGSTKKIEAIFDTGCSLICSISKGLCEQLGVTPNKKYSSEATLADGKTVKAYPVPINIKVEGREFSITAWSNDDKDPILLMGHPWLEYFDLKIIDGELALEANADKISRLNNL